MEKLLISLWTEPLFIYKKDGIIISKGEYKGYNLSKNYKENKTEVISMLDKISDENILHIKDLIKMIKEDLNNEIQ